jgi:hypothetical protein
VRRVRISLDELIEILMEWKELHGDTIDLITLYKMAHELAK